jgi:hypothetical protein
MGIKQPEREADHSPQSRTEFKECALTGRTSKKWEGSRAAVPLSNKEDEHNTKDYRGIR